MILKKLYIKNMFSYYGKIEINLEPKDNKNIILIGARNGRGKTSFLRILRILMHGIKENSDFTKQDGNLTPNEYALGKKNKWAGIFYKHHLIDRASIKGVFEFEGKELIVERKFKKISKSTFSEDTTVKFDLKEESSPQTFLNNTLPNNFAQFFFFDGEKLEELMNTQNLNIKDSLEVLLNIKTYEKLISNIKAVQNSYKKDTKDTPTSDEIEKLEHSTNSLISEMNINRTDIQSIEKEIKQFKVDITEQSEKLTSLLVDKKIDIKPLKLEKEKIEKELIYLKEYIGKKIKGTDFLVLMVESLSRNYLSKLENDKTNYQLDQQLKNFSDNLRNMIRRIQDDLFDVDDLEYHVESYKVDFYKDRLDDLRKDEYQDFSKRMKSKNKEQIIHYNKDDKNRLNTIFEEKAMLHEKFTRLKNIEQELKTVKSKLEHATENASENDDTIAQYKAEKEQLENKKAEKEQKIGELKKDSELKSERRDSLNVEIKNLENLLHFSQPILNSIQLSETLIDFFQEFKLRLLQKKIEELENNFNHHLSELVYDKNWIKQVQINLKFEIKILDNLEREVPIGSLSAGQKQILATALIQALGSVSQVKSFICIDTPLARIDLENREQIITKYYPNASKQVIILSTNSEIDPSKKDYSFMKDYIAREYTIISKDYKSTFEDGYFSEIERLK